MTNKFHWDIADLFVDGAAVFALCMLRCVAYQHEGDAATAAAGVWLMGVKSVKNEENLHGFHFKSWGLCAKWEKEMEKFANAKP